jgi:pimeloyl-ACP methyl ester carboxylesterase
VPSYRVAWFQQRGIAPSTESGPHDVDQHVRDVGAVLNHLGWDDALVVGHSRETWASIQEGQPGLASRLPGIEVPFTFVHGGSSPMPVIQSSASVDLLPDAELEVVEGAGHFVWYERPGAVRAALDRLAARTSG